MNSNSNDADSGASLSDAELGMQPASRENKTPLAVNAPIRAHMHGLCKSCAYASDLCKGQHRRQNGDATFGGVTECGGYSMANGQDKQPATTNATRNKNNG